MDLLIMNSDRLRRTKADLLRDVPVQYAYETILARAFQAARVPKVEKISYYVGKCDKKVRDRLNELFDEDGLRVQWDHIPTPLEESWTVTVSWGDEPAP